MALVQADALFELMGAEGEAAPLKDAGSVADGTPLLLWMLLVAVPENDAITEADSVPPQREGVPLLEGTGVRLPDRDGVVELLAQVEPLPVTDGVSEPLALTQLDPDGAPPEGDSTGDSVPEPLLEIVGETDADSIVLRDGAALLRVAQAVGGALAAEDGDAEKEREEGGETVARVVAEESTAELLGLPELEPTASEGVAQAELLRELLALPEAVLGADADADAEAQWETPGVAHGEGVLLPDIEALPVREAIGLAVEGMEAEAVRDACEPLGRGVALAVSSVDREGEVLVETVGLPSMVLVAVSETV